MIQKYGRTVGKEKIEKNTPIFEALTNQNIAIKYRLIGSEASSASLSTIYLPTLSAGLTSIDLGSSASGKPINKNCDFTLKVNNSSSPSDVGNFIETNYSVEISDRFFTVSAVAGVSSNVGGNFSSVPGDPNKTANYGFKTPDTSKTTSFTLNVAAKSIDNATLKIYGKPISSGTSTRVITSYMKVTGSKFGTTLIIPVTYTA